MSFHCRLQEDLTFLQHFMYNHVDQVPPKFWLKGKIGWWPWIALTLCWVSLASLKQWNLTDLFFSASLNQELFIWIYICWHVIKHFPQTLNPIHLEQCSVHENSCEFFSLHFHVVQHHVCIWRLQQPPPEWHPEVHTWEMWGFWQCDVLPAGRSWRQMRVGSQPSSLHPLGKCNSGAAAKGLWRLSSQARYVSHSFYSLFWRVCRVFFSFQILSRVNCMPLQCQVLDGGLWLCFHVSWEPFLWPNVMEMWRSFYLLLLKLLVHEIFFLPCFLDLLFYPKQASPARNQSWTILL